MKRTVWIILGIVVLLLVAGGSFFGGTVYGKNQAQTAFAARRQGGFPGARTAPARASRVRTHAPAGRAASSARSTASVTVSSSIKDNNGQQTQVKVTDTTLIEKQAAVKLTDLADRGDGDRLGQQGHRRRYHGAFGAGGAGRTFRRRRAWSHARSVIRREDDRFSH